MTKQPVSAERLAALIDGTLSRTERAALLEELAEDDSAYDLLVESGAVASDTGLFPNKSRWRRWIPAGLAAAAALAFVALRFSWTDPLTKTLLPLARTAAQGVRAPLTGDPGVAARWPGFLGEAERPKSVIPSDQAIGFRMGQCISDLELASEAGDSGGVKYMLWNLHELAANRRNSWQVVEEYEEFSGRPTAPTKEERARTAKALRKLVREPEWIEIGAAIEAGRIAAASGQVQFFAPDHELAQTLRRLALRLPAEGPDAGDFPHLFRVFVDDLFAEPQPSLKQLQARLTSLIRLGGR